MHLKWRQILVQWINNPCVRVLALFNVTNSTECEQVISIFQCDQCEICNKKYRLNEIVLSFKINFGLFLHTSMFSFNWLAHVL